MGPKWGPFGGLGPTFGDHYVFSGYPRVAPDQTQLMSYPPMLALHRVSLCSYYMMARTAAIGDSCTAIGSGAILTDAGVINVKETATGDGASALVGTVTAGGLSGIDKHSS